MNRRTYLSMVGAGATLFGTVKPGAAATDSQNIRSESQLQSMKQNQRSNHQEPSFPLKITDTVGDDDGPGGFEYPTAEEFKDGAFDMNGLTIYDEGDAWTFEVEIDGPVENAYDFGSGFAVQVLQMYVRDPDADDDAPTRIEGRPGSGLTFQQPWHYVVHITGYGQVVEDASSEAGVFADETGDPTVLADSDESNGISARGDSENSTISFTVAKDVIGGGNIADKEIGLFIFANSGYFVGDILPSVGEEAAEYQIGTGNDIKNNINTAFDMIDPVGIVDQSDALSYTETEPATIPLFSIDEAVKDQLVTITDTVGDDDGPGGFEYPTAEEFKDGVFDMTGLTIYDEGGAWTFEVGIDGPVEDAYDFGSGFAVQVLQMYVRDPDADDDAPTRIEGRPGSGLTFRQPWHYVVHVTGRGQVVEDASSEAGVFADETGDPTVLADSEEGTAISASGDSENSTISFTVAKDVIGGGNIADKEIGLFIFSEDEFGVGGIRTSIDNEAAKYQIGIGSNIEENVNTVLDMIDPNGNQYDALDYTASTPAEVSLFSVDSVNSPSPTLPGQNNPAADLDGDGLFEDINGDGTSNVEDVSILFENRESNAVQNNSQLFNFDKQGKFNIVDIAKLFLETIK